MNLNNPFWLFCLSLWKDDSIAKLAISLSVTQGVDVVGVFFILYAQQHHRQVNESNFRAIQTTYRPLIEQYRTLRRASKDQVAEALYQQQKQLELCAEQHYANALFERALHTGQLNSIELSVFERELLVFAGSRIDSEVNPH